MPNKGHKETFGSDEYVHYIECVQFKPIKFKLYTLSTCSLLHVCHTSKKLFFM